MRICTEWFGLTLLIAPCTFVTCSMLRKQPGREKEAAEARADYHRLDGTTGRNRAVVLPLIPHFY